jgi:type II secretory ATPase GspE/PulE/Tfp pilus assembly ATPase PilB-like protein
MQNWAALHDRLAPLLTQWPQHVSELVDVLLDQAARAGASDVHFEPNQTSLFVRMRIDGVLQTVATLPRELAGNVVARLKVLAELLTYRLDVPQEGRARRRDPQPSDMRVSTFPTIHGERAVVRLFDPTGHVLDLEELGLPQSIVPVLESALAETSGVLLLTGPGGSGKTTTIYACLRHLVRASHGGRHIVTLEDPVEIALEHVSQSQMHPASGFDFARGLRSVLRQDPEVIMIGEIRDRETAQIAIEAGLTGHLVISTVHSGSACGVVGRLLEMGIEPHLITSSLKAVMGQRLLRRLCTSCARPADVAGPKRSVARNRGSGPTLRADPATPVRDWEAVGCEGCFGTGYRGRRLIAEVLVVNETVRGAILDRCDTNELERRLDVRGHASLRRAAADALAAGEVSLEEVERVLGRGRLD